MAALDATTRAVTGPVQTCRVCHKPCLSAVVNLTEMGPDSLDYHAVRNGQALFSGIHDGTTSYPISDL